MSSRLIRSEARSNALDDAHDVVGILRAETKRPGVDAGKLLEEHHLPFHDGKGRFRPEIPKAQHGGSVRDHGDAVALDRKDIGFARIDGNRLRHATHAGRIDHGQDISRAQGHAAVNANFPSEMKQEDSIRRG